MSVHQDKTSRRWYVKYQNRTYRKDFDNKKFETKTHARNFELILKVKADKLEHDLLYFDMLELYLDHKKQRVIPSSYSETIRMLNIFKPYIPNKRLSQYNPKDFIKFEDYLISSDYSSKYKNAILSYLKNTFLFAERYYGLKLNPTRFIERIKPTHQETQKKLEKRFNTWKAETFLKFYTFMNKEAELCTDTGEMHRWRCSAIFYLLSFDLGTRLSETNGLQIVDYNPDTLIINIHQQCDDKDNYKLTQLKTPNSIRLIYLSKFAAAELNKHIEYLKSLSGFSDQCFLVGGHKPMSPQTLKRKKDYIIKRHNIVPSLTIHEFRHSHATNLIDAGAELTAVSRRLGHSSIAITERIYMHVLEKKRLEIAQINDKIYENIV